MAFRLKIDKPEFKSASPPVKDDEGKWTEATRRQQLQSELPPTGWDSPILQFENLAKGIETEGDTLTGVITGEQKTVAENMLVGAGHKFAVLIVIPGRVGASFPTS